MSLSKTAELVFWAGRGRTEAETSFGLTWNHGNLDRRYVRAGPRPTLHLQVGPQDDSCPHKRDLYFFFWLCIQHIEVLNLSHRD